MSAVPEGRPDPAAMARRGAWTIGSFLIGLVAAPLPRRWRSAIPLLESSAWPEASIASGLLQSAIGLALFAAGYVAWMNGQYAAIDAAAEAAGHAGTLDVEGKQVAGRALLLGNPLLPIIYALTSFSGLATATCWLGGGIRMVHGAITKDVMPDPVLGLVDWLARLLHGRAAHEARERSKDRSPDRLIVGEERGGFALAIETASDFDWREGNTVVVASEWYRLLRRLETRTPRGLRIRYELERMPVGVAIRGMRRYDPGHAPEIVRASES